MLEQFKGFVLEEHGTGKASPRCGHMNSFLRGEQVLAGGEIVWLHYWFKKWYEKPWTISAFKGH